uniref:Uncharacterized protein n=1 Tax=Arundo donax TaxID=35708 RepID=A0A0A9AES7_ARUDO
MCSMECSTKLLGASACVAILTSDTYVAADCYRFYHGSMNYGKVSLSKIFI